MASRSDRFSGASRRSTRSRSSSRRRRSHRCAARASAMAGDCCRLSGQVVLPLEHAAAGDLRPGELRLSPRPHRSAIADRPGASTSRFRTADRTIGTRRGGGIVALEPCCTGGIAPATPRGLSQRPSHIAGALTDLPGRRTKAPAARRPHRFGTVAARRAACSPWTILAALSPMPGCRDARLPVLKLSIPDKVDNFPVRLSRETPKLAADAGRISIEADLRRPKKLEIPCKIPC
jgi:hypothetical protein